MSAEPARPVEAERYTEEYFRGACGGVEFFDRYGPEVLKPSMAYSLQRARLRPGQRVLDLGCGRGELLYQARKAGAWGVGTDYAAPALKIAARVSGSPGVLCDAKALPFSDDTFDRVFFLGVMDHLHDWELERCFAELARVLKPGGSVLVHTCSNRHYYKNWSWGARRALARGLRALGLDVRDPSRPRSDEDVALHVNEHTAPSMAAFFRRIGWSAHIEPRPNYKLLLGSLYGSPLPEGFPLRPAPRWKERLYLGLLWWAPLNWLLARELFCEAWPPRRGPAA